jgi:hypothetical protein
MLNRLNLDGAGHALLRDPGSINTNLQLRALHRRPLSVRQASPRGGKASGRICRMVLGQVGDGAHAVGRVLPRIGAMPGGGKIHFTSLHDGKDADTTAERRERHGGSFSTREPSARPAHSNQLRARHDAGTDPNARNLRLGRSPAAHLARHGSCGSGRGWGTTRGRWLRPMFQRWMN